MFSRSNLISTLVSGLVMFILGYVLWAVVGTPLLEDHIITNVMKDPVDMVHVALGCFIATFALSTVYGKWAQGHHDVKQGAEFGLLIGIFVGLGAGLIWFGSSTLMDLTGHLLDAILYVVNYLVVGIVIALVYKATSPKTKS